MYNSYLLVLKLSSCCYKLYFKLCMPFFMANKCHMLILADTPSYHYVYTFHFQLLHRATEKKPFSQICNCFEKGCVLKLYLKKIVMQIKCKCSVTRSKHKVSLQTVHVLAAICSSDTQCVTNTNNNIKMVHYNHKSINRCNS